MNIVPLDIVIHIINIVVLYVILRALLYKPVKKFMDARAAGIQADLDRAALANKEAGVLKGEYEQKIGDAEETANRMVLEGHRRAGESVQAILDDANAQAEGIVSGAREKAAAERSELLSAMKGEITDMAVSLAGEILKREVSEADNQRVIDDFFDRAVSGDA